MRSEGEIKIKLCECIFIFIGILEKNRIGCPENQKKKSGLTMLRCFCAHEWHLLFCMIQWTPVHVTGNDMSVAATFLARVQLRGLKHQ